MSKKKRKESETNSDLLKGVGATRTDMHCTSCSKNFTALLDYSLDGNHVVECPWCGHEHCRGIRKGVVTEDRWDHRNGDTHRVSKRSTWRSTGQPIMTSSASAFIRDRWLNRDSQ